MGRSPCCSKVGLMRGPWSAKEDNLLTNYIQQHGEGQWRSLPKNAGLLRCGKSCRLRWMNYLRPGIKRGNISEDEEDLIVRLHRLLGNRWSLIAGRLPGRTDNEIKNHWNTHLLKKLKNSGVQISHHKESLPKSTKIKKSATAAAAGGGGASAVSAMGKKKKKQKKVVNVEEKSNNNEKESLTVDVQEEAANEIEDRQKTKVYLPKPIRVSPAFSRSTSYDSLTSGASNSDGGEAAAVADAGCYLPAAWPPLFEMEYENYYGGGGEEDEFIMGGGGGGYFLPLLHHSDLISSDVNMLEKVYDEYVQLL